MLTKLITRVHLFYYQHRQNLYLRFRASLGHQLLFLSQCRCQREPRVEYQIGLRPFHVSSPLFRICHHAYSAHLASHRVLASCTRSRIDDDDACHLRSSIFAARLEISDDSGEYRENAKASVWKSWRSFGQRLGSSGCGSSFFYILSFTYCKCRIIVQLYIIITHSLRSLYTLRSRFFSFSFCIFCTFLWYFHPFVTASFKFLLEYLSRTTVFSLQSRIHGERYEPVSLRLPPETCSSTYLL